MKIEIRKAKIEDLEDVIQLNEELFKYETENFDNSLDNAWPRKNEKYFKKSIEKGDFLTLVAVADGKVVGYLIGSVHDSADYRKQNKIAEVENTFVLKNFRGKKIGEKLFNKFIEWVKSKNISKIEVTASAKNTNAIGFYKKLGFIDYNLTLERDI